ncbi:MAG: bifunctional phosphopantothenoylcysteine decarboxylase/phosphopantothenate--cysteine ligase CoaBC [Anaerolineaceae bacterium]|jgi:phosphopantothenoylcysteine decarboxylase/phosphopantothenate--cysteine ligase|nr:bifunctional phosphopantothenoylcysteine decarboxylase/phosphopantothenate--cysteine ligase CoaBC [Anaerolineaceae bacterium]
MNVMTGKRILLGVTGSLAAYQAATIATKLVELGAIVDVFMTFSAKKLISPLIFQVITGRHVYTDEEWWQINQKQFFHENQYEADLMLIVPASGNTISKIANGISDNILIYTAMSVKCPIVLVPDLDLMIGSNIATIENLEKLKSRGIQILMNADNHLQDQIFPVEDIIKFTRLFLSQNGPLKGRKVVVTVGATRESIDPVRVITNRSTGLQGWSITQAALDAGAKTVLITTIHNRPVPYGTAVIKVDNAQEMKDAVLEEVKDADALVMTAEVADFKPLNYSPHKLKKEDDLAKIELVPTDDILWHVAQQKIDCNCPNITIGFASESKNLLENANIKLTSKNLDFIVADHVVSFDENSETIFNRLTILHAGGEVEIIDDVDKSSIGYSIVERIEDLLWKKTKK